MGGGLSSKKNDTSKNPDKKDKKDKSNIIVLKYRFR